MDEVYNFDNPWRGKIYLILVIVAVVIGVIFLSGYYSNTPAIASSAGGQANISQSNQTGNARITKVTFGDVIPPLSSVVSGQVPMPVSDAYVNSDIINPIDVTYGLPYGMRFKYNVLIDINGIQFAVATYGSGALPDHFILYSIDADRSKQDGFVRQYGIAEADNNDPYVAKVGFKKFGLKSYMWVHNNHLVIVSSYYYSNDLDSLKQVFVGLFPPDEKISL